MRQLASIQRITNITPIIGGDRVELAQILGWQVVIAKKDNFKIGDLVIYIEIDSILPKTSWTEFLVDKNHPDKPIRIKTRKFLKTISQGLVTPLSLLSPDITDGIKEGENVTDILNITKYDPQATEEDSLNEFKHRSKVMQYLMGYNTFRNIYLALNSKEKTNFPSGVSKTDEENIQKCVEIISENFDKSFNITEKLEGQSGSFFTIYEKHWGFRRKIFGVASRNMWLKTKDNSKYWQSAKKYNLEKILRSIPMLTTIQAEQIGVGIQGNIYKLDDVQLRVFNVIIDGRRLPYSEMEGFCKSYNLIPVPLIDGDFIPSKHITSNDKATIVKWFLDYSNGISTLYKTKREGIVIRANDNPMLSCKIRSPNYLIEHDE